MSLGETPLTLEACESVVGFISINFCIASVDKDLTLNSQKRVV